MYAVALDRQVGRVSLQPQGFKQVRHVLRELSLEQGLERLADLAPQSGKQIFKPTGSGIYFAASRFAFSIDGLGVV